MTDQSSDLVQGTLDMLILKTLALETMHGYGVALRIEQMSGGIFRVNAGSLFVAFEPLQRAAKLQPANPAVHYHLAIALRRSGNKEEADKEFAVYKRTSEQARHLTHDVQTGVLGPQQVDPQEQQ